VQQQTIEEIEEYAIAMPTCLHRFAVSMHPTIECYPRFNSRRRNIATTEKKLAVSLSQNRNLHLKQLSLCILTFVYRRNIDSGRTQARRRCRGCHAEGTSQYSNPLMDSRTRIQRSAH
jgi:hypothetical protein